jgi:capsule polysaccharide export protein KpsE/RkpR
MTGDRTEAAVQRIEAALARIARAADGARAAPAPAAPSVTALVERQETLRETVAKALADLDKLLGEIEA